MWELRRLLEETGVTREARVTRETRQDYCYKLPWPGYYRLFHNLLLNFNDKES